jgi:hypothetical protein
MFSMTWAKLICTHTIIAGVRINSTILAAASTKLLIEILSNHRSPDENYRAPANIPLKWNQFLCGSNRFVEEE